MAAQAPVPSHVVSSTRVTVRQVALVNKVPLTSDRLDAMVNKLIPQQLFHRTVAPQKMAAFRQQALQQLVDEELQYQEGVRRRVPVPQAERDRALADLQKRYGGPQAFDQARTRAGVTMKDLRDEINRELTIQKVLEREVTSGCQVSGGEAATYFAQHPERFVIPEQLHVFAITIGVDPSSTPAVRADAKTRAEKVLSQIGAGAPFEEMARAHSTDPSKERGGDMGLLHRGSLEDAFEQAARDLRPGQVSGVVESIYGYHIIRVTEIRPPQKKTFADVAEQLQKDLTTTRCAEARVAWIARLRSEAVIELR